MEATMRPMVSVLLAAATITATPNFSAAQDVLAQRYNVYVQKDKLNVFQKTIKELNTPEGQAVLTVVAAYIGVDPGTVNAAVAGTADMIVPNDQQDTSGIIRTPVGYTICLAKPSNPNMGAGQHGIETHGDTTFNT